MAADSTFSDRVARDAFGSGLVCSFSLPPVLRFSLILHGLSSVRTRWLPCDTADQMPEGRTCSISGSGPHVQGLGPREGLPPGRSRTAASLPPVCRPPASERRAANRHLLAVPMKSEVPYPPASPASAPGIPNRPSMLHHTCPYREYGAREADLSRICVWRKIV